MTVPDRYGIPLPMAECDCGLCLHLHKIPEDFYKGKYRELVGWHRGAPFNYDEHERDQWLYAAKLFNFIDIAIQPRAPLTFLHIGAEPGRKDPIEETAVMRGYHADSTSRVEDGWDGPYDIIAICRTIEHLEHPDDVLKAAMTSAKYVYVDILDHKDEHNFKIDHIYYFNHHTMSRLLRDLGYRLVATSTDVDPGHISYLAQPSL